MIKYQQSRLVYDFHNKHPKLSIEGGDILVFDNQRICIGLGERTPLEAVTKLLPLFFEEGLDFYGKDFYHPYRNWFIGKFADHLEEAENLAYFLKTVSFYTWGVESDTDDDCPYKLLVGTERSSTITEVSSDENKKSALSGKVSPASDQYKNIKTTYDNKSQSFKASIHLCHFSS